MTETLKTLDEARQAGLQFYLGRECQKGHDGKRYTRNRMCVQCEQARWKAAPKEAAAAKAKKWRKDNPEGQRNADLRYRTKHVDKIRALEKLRRQTHRTYFLAHNAKRRAAKLQATPAWADQKAIQHIYDTRPEGYHVDHIVPLQGRNVCGLHVENNLQHLPALENQRKSNR